MHHRLNLLRRRSLNPGRKEFPNEPKCLAPFTRKLGIATYDGFGVLFCDFEQRGVSR